MEFPVLPFATFTLVTIFTPGPNNIASMGYGVTYGYKRTLKFLLGVCIGSFVVFMLISFFSHLISRYMPKVFPVLKYIGAAYIVFLAVQVMRSAGIKTDNKKPEARLYQGVLLQFLNPKGHIYYLTVITVFIHPYFNSVLTDLLFVSILLVLIFSSVSLYTAGGSIIKALVKQERIYRIINIILGLALLYSAAAIILSDVNLKTVTS
jgi:cysteine/O-acetylserine efflux protein